MYYEVTENELKCYFVSKQKIRGLSHMGITLPMVQHIKNAKNPTFKPNLTHGKMSSFGHKFKHNYLHNMTW